MWASCPSPDWAVCSTVSLSPRVSAGSSLRLRLSRVAACRLFIAVVSPGAQCGLQGTQASAVAMHAAYGLWSAGSAVGARGPGCPVAGGISSDQGSNLCPLHRQADS